jgi:membrane fusion protein (multidrug efflux system)
MMEQFKRWISTPRGALVTAFVIIVIAVLAFRTAGKGGGATAKGPGGPGGGAPPSMPPMPVDVDTARVQSIVDAVRATGRIEAVQAVELRSDEQGRVTALRFHEGQLVARGAPLVSIDDAMLRAQAERADADRDLARQQLARVQRLRDQNAATPADLERAQANARTANATLAVLQLQIARSVVRAPFSGVVGQRLVSLAVSLKLGQTVEFSVAAQPGRTFAARVDFIDPVVQQQNRTIMVKGLAPNPGRVLRPGMFIEARLATATRASAIVIPEDAVQPLRTTNIVWVVDKGKASRRVVSLGARAQGIVEVTSGVKAGELVVVGGLERMAEGMPLMAQPRKAAKAG